jgi:hypothetical protein
LIDGTVFCPTIPLRTNNQSGFFMARFGFAFFGSGVRFGSPDASTASHMRNLSRFLDNPFDDLRISLARLIAFATDNI